MKDKLKSIAQWAEAITIFTIVYYATGALMCLICCMIYNPEFRKHPIETTKKFAHDTIIKCKDLFTKVGKKIAGVA